MVHFPVSPTKNQRAQRRTRIIPGWLDFVMVGPTSILTVLAPFWAGTVIVLIIGSIIGHPTMMMRNPRDACMMRSVLCFTRQKGRSPLMTKGTPSKRSQSWIIFSIACFCGPINGISRIERFPENQRSSMMTSPETTCSIRMVLSVGLVDINLANLRMSGFIG